MRRFVLGCLLTVMALGSSSPDTQAQQPPPVTVFTEAQAAAGKVAYESVCVNCHTYALTGRTGDPRELPALSSLEEAFQKGIQQANGKIPPLAGEAFMKRWAAQTTQALSTRIASAIGGFPPVGLDDYTANNLAAYILQASGAQSGTQALGIPGTMDVLIRDIAATTTGR